MKKQTSIEKIMYAKAVAVIGASNRPGSIGNEVMKRLTTSKFDGRIYPVNPHEAEIEGLKCFKNVRDVGKPIDVAIIAVPSESVLQVVDQCNDARIANVIVFSAGFKETGHVGAKLEQDLVKKITQYKMHMIGPNCLGVVNVVNKLNASFMPKNLPRRGKIGFVSQSGALISGIANILENKNYNFSQVVSLGNQADIDVADIIEFWEKEDSVKVIMVYAENIKNLPHFKEVCARVGKVKPIVILKAGRSEQGKQATASHTGALADDEKLLDSVFESAGVTRELYLRDFLNTAQVFNSCNLPKGNKLAILTNAGGPGIIATDAANDLNVQMAQLSELTKEKLFNILPKYASIKNPVDIVASASLEQFVKSAEVLLASQEVDILLVIYLYITVKNDFELIEELNKLKQRYPNKSIVTIFQTDEAFFDKLAQHPEIKVPVYSYAIDAIKAVKRLTQRRDYLSKHAVMAKNLPLDKESIRKIIKKCKLNGEKFVSAEKSLAVLRACGLPVAKYGMAKTLAQAKKLAKEIGYPLVIKVSSSKFSHKTDIGGVITNIRSEIELKRKWEILQNNLLLNKATAGFEGVIVMKQIEDVERQFVVGTVKKDVEGNTIMFGLGGIFVEALNEVSFTTCPINLLGLEKLLSMPKVSALMGNLRGYKPVDKQRIAEVILRVSQLVEDNPDIVEFDLNPLIADKDGRLVAIDARIVLK